MDNQDAQRLAQMLQQQQMQKMMQGMQSGAPNGMQGAMGEAERMPMPQQPGTPMQSEIPVVSPQGSYSMPMTQPSYAGNMPTNPQMGRRNMLQSAVNSLSQQGAMSNQDAEMMRRR